MDKKNNAPDILELMIGIYCKKKHKSPCLCSDCTALLEYAQERAKKCPFQENKTFCSNCKVHCYRPAQREQIREIMRFSGPRMLWYHPIWAIAHIIETIQHKRKERKL